MKCKICDSNTEKIFEKIILQKFKSGYHKCINCSFVQTDEPIWLEEAYQSAITSLDIGMISRNNTLKTESTAIIDSCFPEAKIFLDFAGGYGIFVRLMRDSGFNFYRQDDYCQNIFSKNFDLKDIQTNKFDVVTAFEVLEHFENPIKEIEKIFNFSDSVIFSTEIAPETNIEIENWWYIAQETGQHIAFYSKKSMEIIAKKFNKNYYCRNQYIHVFTSKKLTDSQIDYAFNNNPIHKKHFWSKGKEQKIEIQRESLLLTDYQYIKNLLNNPNNKQESNQVD